MGRWVPDAQRRLIQAAMELYSKHGFEETTVAEIAKHAGLTERTFFRYFPDKREVLFSGSDVLEQSMVEALESAPAKASPMDAVAVALENAATLFTDRLAFARRRQAVIDANPELQERERKKLASISVAFSDTLQRRGVSESTARLVGEIGIAVFKIAFERWLDDSEEHDFAHHIRGSLEELKSIGAGRI